VLKAAGAAWQGDTGDSFGAETVVEESPGDPDCPYCHGAGFVRRDVPFGHPDFGRALPCSCVLAEQVEERQARLKRYSNVGSLARQTFESLTPRGRSPSKAHQERFAAAAAEAQRFADGPHGWLVFLGESGTGKTHLAAAIANRLIERGTPVFFAVVPDLLDHLRMAYGPESELPYDRLFDTVRNAPVLVLDAIEAHASTPWAEEKLFQVVNHRYNAQLPTIFTTAAPLEDLDERLRTRLGDPALTQVHILEDGPGRAFGLSDALGLPLLQEMTFASFQYRPAPPQITYETSENLRKAFTTARNYAGQPDGWLVFLGDTGAGKTHLAAAIANDVKSNGGQARFVVVPDLLDNLRSAMYGEDRDRRDVIEAVRTASLLVLDDLGVHSATAWAQEKLFQILNYRYNARLATVITVSRSLEDLPQSWVSRMYDPKLSMICEISAPDYRGSQPRARRAETPRRARKQ
jgi:DNA replication protein DnaC